MNNYNYNSMISIYTSPLITCVLSPLVSLWRLWSQPLAARPVDKRWPLITAGCCRIVPWQTPTRIYNIQYLMSKLNILCILPVLHLQNVFLMELYCLHNAYIFLKVLECSSITGKWSNKRCTRNR